MLKAGKRIAMFGIPISFSISRMGIGVKYTCYSTGTHGGNKCPDKKSAKCYKCIHCVAQMQAADATRLLSAFTERVNDKRKGAVPVENRK